jgi:hypothetical protein
MAEASERPGAVPSGGAEAPSSPVRRPVPPPPFRGDSPDGPEYRALSLAAITGFALAVLFAAVLALFAVVAWHTETALGMRWDVLLVPFAAAVVSALGWLRVRQSEGTKAGAKLAVAGIVVSLIAGGSYGAYVVAAWLAMGQTASEFAVEWMNKIREEKIDEAFRDTLPPENRPRSKDGPRLHQELELRFNAGRDGSFRGDLTGFENGDIVRTVNHGRTPEAGADTQVLARGVKSVSPVPAGFTAEVIVEVRTPERDVEFLVTANGAVGEDGRRQWFIQRSGTGPLRVVKDHDLGARTTELKNSSAAFVMNWVALVGAGQVDEAYLQTQPPERRAAPAAEYGARLAASGLASAGPLGRAATLTAPGPARLLYLPGYRAFAEGGLVQTSPGFWAEGSLLKEIPVQARAFFGDPGADFALAVHMDPPGMPLWEQKGDRVLFYHTFQANLFHRSLIQGAFVAEADARVLNDGSAAPPWRLAGVELWNGRAMPGGSSR